jgi:hypothetical protein
MSKKKFIILTIYHRHKVSDLSFKANIVRLDVGSGTQKEMYVAFNYSSSPSHRTLSRRAQTHKVCACFGVKKKSKSNSIYY